MVGREDSRSPKPGGDVVARIEDALAAGKPPESADKNVCPTAQGSIKSAEDGPVDRLSGGAAAETAALRESSSARPTEDRGEIVQLCSHLFTSVRIF
jgi:hypothetical protein